MLDGHNLGTVIGTLETLKTQAMSIIAEVAPAIGRSQGPDMFGNSIPEIKVMKSNDFKPEESTYLEISYAKSQMTTQKTKMKSSNQVKQVHLICRGHIQTKFNMLHNKKLRIPILV